MSQPGANDDLPRDERLSRAWAQASRDEPPAGMDDRIRAAARRAVQAGPRPAGASAFERWRVPLSLAAVLVISATVTLLVAERETHLPTTQDEAPAPGAASKAVGAPASPPQADDAERAAKPQEQGAPLPEVPSRAAPPMRAREETANAPPPAPVEAPARADQRGPVPASQRGVPSARPFGEAASSEAQAPAPMAKERDEAKRQSTLQPDAASALRKLETAPRLQDAPAGAVPPAQLAPATPAASDNIKPREPEAAAETALAPSAWIERIRELRRAGQLEAAQRSLERFQRRYPDYPLPSDLTASE